MFKFRFLYKGKFMELLAGFVESYKTGGTKEFPDHSRKGESSQEKDSEDSLPSFDGRREEASERRGEARDSDKQSDAKWSERFRKLWKPDDYEKESEARPTSHKKEYEEQKDGRIIPGRRDAYYESRHQKPRKSDSQDKYFKKFYKWASERNKHNDVDKTRGPGSSSSDSDDEDGTRKKPVKFTRGDGTFEDFEYDEVMGNVVIRKKDGTSDNFKNLKDLVRDYNEKHHKEYFDKYVKNVDTGKSRGDGDKNPEGNLISFDDDTEPRGGRRRAWPVKKPPVDEGTDF